MPDSWYSGTPTPYKRKRYKKPKRSGPSSLRPKPWKHSAAWHKAREAKPTDPRALWQRKQRMLQELAKRRAAPPSVSQTSQQKQSQSGY
jgi:hypothetical protein